MGRTGRGAPSFSYQEHTLSPTPSLCLSQASSFLARGWGGALETSAASHRPRPLPKPGTEQGRGSPPLQVPEGVTLLSDWPSQVWREGRRRVGLWWTGPTLLGKAVLSWATSPTRQLIGCYSTYDPGQSQGLGRWSREPEGAQGRAGPDGMGLERDVGVGCQLGPRGDKAQAW